MADWLSQQPALPLMVAREGERPAAGRGLLAGTSDHLTLKAADRLAVDILPVERIAARLVDAVVRP
jgi:chemotaxis response regulator CheB